MMRRFVDSRFPLISTCQLRNDKEMDYNQKIVASLTNQTPMLQIHLSISILMFVTDLDR